MISTLKNEKYIWSMNPRETLEGSIVVPLGILFALVKRKIWQGSSKSGRFLGDPLLVPFLPFVLAW